MPYNTTYQFVIPTDFATFAQNFYSDMTQEQFNSIEWHRGNAVRLTNGKEYPVAKVRNNTRLILYSAEYESYFIADYRIVEERTSDFVDDAPKKQKQQNVQGTETKDAMAPSTKNVAQAPTEPAVKETQEAVGSQEETPAPLRKKRPRIRVVANTTVNLSK